MKNGPERELVARYLERAQGSGKPLALTGFDVHELAESRAGSAASRKAEEAKAIRATLKRGSISDIMDHGLHEFLEDFIRQNNHVSAQISEGYRFNQ